MAAAGETGNPPVCGSGPLPFEGVRVLDLNGGAAPHCGQTLALFGAEVVLVEREDARASRDDLAWAAFNAGKKSVALDWSTPEGRAQLDDLARSCDIVIDSDRTGIAKFEPRSASPRLIHVTVSAFGQDGPRAGWKANELVAQAAGGLLYLSGDREYPPAVIGFPLAIGVAGAQAACAVLFALAQRQQTGEGARIDVSMQESVADLLYTTQFMSREFSQPGKRGAEPLTVGGRRVTRRGLWECADGLLQWNLWTGRGLGRWNLPFFEWLRDEGISEAEGLLKTDWEKLGAADLTPEILDSVYPVVDAFFKRTSKATLKREALARRLMIAIVQDLEDVATDEQLHERQAFREFDLPSGKTVPIVATPVRSSAYSVEISRHVPAHGEHTASVVGKWLANPPKSASDGGGAPGSALPLAGLKILDLSWAIVAPITTKYLGMFGADVVKVEFRGRPDPVRQTGPFPERKPRMDRGTTFISIGASKRSAGLDINHPEARDVIYRLAIEADIVCENFTPGTAARLGYGYEDFRGLRPDTIMISLSMQGQTGKWASHPGIGSHLQAMSGIDHVTGFPQGMPNGPNQVLPDFIGPWISIASLLAALEHRRKTGEGQYLDISQLEAIMMYLQPLLLEHQLSGRSPERRGNVSLTASPHGVYPVEGDDRWIAIAVETDDEWRQLHAQLPSGLGDRFPAALPLQERLERRTSLDEAIASWTSSQDGETLMTRLQRAGIAAYIASDGLQVISDPQLEFRDHFRMVEHGVVGAQAVDAPSFRISNLEPDIRPGPLYAADTEDVLKGWLGMDSDEVADLIASKAIVF